MEPRQRISVLPGSAYSLPDFFSAPLLAALQGQSHETLPDFRVTIADASHVSLAAEICAVIATSAQARGTGISRRSPELLQTKMIAGEAVIAFAPDGRWAGFSFLSSWDNGRYVSNSGLIVAPEFRHTGIAKRIKRKIFELSRLKYPEASIFSLTSGLAVMKMNHELGFEPVTYSELTTEDAFWKGCSSCVNCPVLTSKERKNCLCTAMLYDPKHHITDAGQPI